MAYCKTEALELSQTHIEDRYVDSLCINTPYVLYCPGYHLYSYTHYLGLDFVDYFTRLESPRLNVHSNVQIILAGYHWNWLICQILNLL